MCDENMQQHSGCVIGAEWYRNDEMQESQGFVNGSVRIKALVVLLPKLVIEQGIQVPGQGLGLLLQPKLFIQHGLPVPLQCLVLPALLKTVQLLELGGLGGLGGGDAYFCS